jgi:hypothetical protein
MKIHPNRSDRTCLVAGLVFVIGLFALWAGIATQRPSDNAAALVVEAVFRDGQAHPEDLQRELMTFQETESQCSRQAIIWPASCFAVSCLLLGFAVVRQRTDQRESEHPGAR